MYRPQSCLQDHAGPYANKYQRTDTLGLDEQRKP
jgi:hypothetical protein